MSINRVSWTEGLFLRAHLFQQQERYLEFFAHQRTLATEAFFWGFRKISLNTERERFHNHLNMQEVAIFLQLLPFNFSIQTSE